MQISLIAWEKHNDVISRRLMWLLVIVPILGAVSFFILPDFFWSIMGLLLLLALILGVIRLVCYVNTKKFQKIYIFSKQTITIIKRQYKMLSVLKIFLLKGSSVSSDYTEENYEYELKYLTSKKSYEILPSFLGFSISKKLITVEWIYNEGNKKARILLENIQDEDWQREKTAICDWIDFARKDVNVLRLRRG